MSGISNNINYPAMQFPDITRFIPKWNDSNSFVISELFKKLNVGLQACTVPGVLNSIFLPFDFIRCVVALTYSYAIEDEEGKLDAKIRLMGMPVNMANCAFQITNYIMQARALLEQPGLALPLKIIQAISCTGIALCCFEGAFEALNLRRQVRFLSRVHTDVYDQLKQVTAKRDLRRGFEALKTAFDNLPTDSKVKNHPAWKRIRNHPERASARIILALRKKAMQELTVMDLEFFQRKYFQISGKAFDLIEKWVIKKLQENRGDLKTFLDSKDPVVSEAFGKKYEHFFQEEGNHLLTEYKNRYQKLPSGEKESAAIELESRYRSFLSRQLKQKVIHSRKAQLARRLQPWFVQEYLDGDLIPVLHMIRSNDPLVKKEGLQRGRDLIVAAKQQAEKKKIIHILSLTAITLSAASFIALLAHGGVVLSASFTTISTVVAFGSGIFMSGLIYHKGWDFRVGDCIPSWLTFGVN